MKLFQSLVLIAVGCFVQFCGAAPLPDPPIGQVVTAVHEEDLPLAAYHLPLVVADIQIMEITQTLPVPEVTPTANVTPSLTPTPPPPDGEPYAIGYSVALREIRVVKFGNGPINRLIVADVHGGYEENTNRLVNYMIDFIKADPEMIPSDITLYILKTLNPDGIARSLDRYGRLNENSVDINRNFNANWKSEWNTFGCWNYLPVSAGTEPESEPETQTLVRFVAEHPIDAMISYHSAGLGIFAGGQSDDKVSDALAKTLSGVSGYRYPPYDTGCEFTGQMIDWASSLGIAAVDVELSNHADIDWYENRAILRAFLDWRR